MCDDVGFVSIEVQFLDRVLLLHCYLDPVSSLRSLPQLVKLEHGGLLLKVAIFITIFYRLLCC